MAEEEIVRVPNLEVAQILFELSLPDTDSMRLQDKLLEHIKTDGERKRERRDMTQNISQAHRIFGWSILARFA